MGGEQFDFAQLLEGDILYVCRHSVSSEVADVDEM
jgi:hypothetical protein